MAEQLAKERAEFTIAEAKAKCRHLIEDAYSVAIAATGGCLDTLAAIKAGFFPIWGSEVNISKDNQLMQKMWHDLTATPSLGDAMYIDPAAVRRPVILKTGFPCQDHCPLGSKLGEGGARGGDKERRAPTGAHDNIRSIDVA